MASLDDVATIQATVIVGAISRLWSTGAPLREILDALDAHMASLGSVLRRHYGEESAKITERVLVDVHARLRSQGKLTLQ
jgi:hypothetical protein